MSFDLERIYALLPAIYRRRDAEREYPLKAILSVIAEQAEILDEDLSQLYDDQFIETCAEWVVPYIGNIVGARGLYDLTANTFSQRGQVAKTIEYRRRKGTLAVIEDLATTVTGWNARAVEFFKLLATSQYTKHIRLENIVTPDMGAWEPLREAFHALRDLCSYSRCAEDRQQQRKVQHSQYRDIHLEDRKLPSDIIPRILH